MPNPHTAAVRILKALLSIAMLMVLIAVAAFYLASMDKHPKDRRFMVQQQEVENA